MVVDDTLLEDADRLAEVDSAGLLRATAMAGAQVRATIDAAAELGLPERVDIGQPRAIVLVARPGGGRSAITLLGELLGAAAKVPVVVADVVPSWVGALDVVFAHSDDPGDPELAAGLERSARHGATVVVSAPEEGPVASSVAGRGMVLSPKLRVPPELAFPRALAAGLLTANALGVLAVDVQTLADRLDDEADRDQPGYDPDANPAKTLALRVAERTPVLLGLDRAALALAHHVEHAFAAHAATVCHVAEYRQAQVQRGLYHAALADEGERNVFADPDDPATVGHALRVILLGVHSGPATEVARAHADQVFPSAQRLVFDGDGSADEVPAAQNLPDEPTRAAVLALRCELAAVYLGLAAGIMGGRAVYASEV